jgi:hypothetical protein
MRPRPGEVLHFSQDPAITHFDPIINPRSSRPGEALVWAVDGPRCPDYWFPRDCPRAMAWIEPGTTADDAERILGHGERVHAIEYAWLRRMQTATVYAYRLPAAPFAPVDPADTFALVARERVIPLGPPEPVGDLIEAHHAAGIQLRLLDNLWPWWDRVITSTVGFSGIRLRNAAPPPVNA